MVVKLPTSTGYVAGFILRSIAPWKPPPNSSPKSPSFSEDWLESFFRELPYIRLSCSAGLKHDIHEKQLQIVGILCKFKPFIGPWMQKRHKDVSWQLEFVPNATRTFNPSYHAHTALTPFFPFPPASVCFQHRHIIANPFGLVVHILTSSSSFFTCLVVPSFQNVWGETTGV